MVPKNAGQVKCLVRSEMDLLRIRRAIALRQLGAHDHNIDLFGWAHRTRAAAADQIEKAAAALEAQAAALRKQALEVRKYDGERGCGFIESSREARARAGDLFSELSATIAAAGGPDDEADPLTLSEDGAVGDFKNLDGLLGLFDLAGPPVSDRLALADAQRELKVALEAAQAAAELVDHAAGKAVSP